MLEAGSVLQARGAQSAPPERQGAAPSLPSTITAMLTGVFLAGMALDLLGFLSALVSARLTPLFLSLTIISANLVVTALLATRMWNRRL